MTIFQTNNQSAASLLRFALGDHAHRRTYRRDRDGRLTFVFDDAERKCVGLSEQFFSKEGIAVTNARELLVCDRAIRMTIGVCLNEGEWINE